MTFLDSSYRPLLYRCSALATSFFSSSLLFFGHPRQIQNIPILNVKIFYHLTFHAHARIIVPYFSSETMFHNVI